MWTQQYYWPGVFNALCCNSPVGLLFCRHTFLMHQRWTILQQLQLFRTKQLQQPSPAEEEVRGYIFIFLLCGTVKNGQVHRFCQHKTEGQTPSSFCSLVWCVCTCMSLLLKSPFVNPCDLGNARPQILLEEELLPFSPSIPSTPYCLPSSTMQVCSIWLQSWWVFSSFPLISQRGLRL